MPRRRRSLPEQLARDALRAFPQYSVKEEVRIGPYRVDLLIGRLAIEVQGTTWHSRPEDMARDERRAQYLRRCGYEVAEVTEAEIKALSPLGLIRHLDDLLRKHEIWAALPSRQGRSVR